MKILHVLTDYNIGGAGRHVLSYIKEHDSTSFKVEVALPDESRLIPDIDRLGVPFYQIRHIRDKSFSVKGFIELFKLFRRVRPDIIHTHASLSGRCAARLLRIPTISTRHYCVDVTPRKTGFPLKQVSRVFSTVFADVIIAVSEEVKNGLVETGTHPAQVEVVYNGVESTEPISKQEKLAIRSRYGIKQDAFVVLQAARLSEEKGYEYTLESAKILMKQEPDIVFLLAGDGKLEEPIKLRIRNEGITNIVMAGFIVKIEELMAIADVQLNASLTEATCLSLLEGMSIGLPAVATSVGGNPFVIKNGDNGLLVPSMSPPDIANAIVRIKNDTELRNNLVAGALKEFNARFRGDVMAKGIENIYSRFRIPS